MVTTRKFDRTRDRLSLREIFDFPNCDFRGMSVLDTQGSTLDFSPGDATPDSQEIIEAVLCSVREIGTIRCSSR